MDSPCINCMGKCYGCSSNCEAYYEYLKSLAIKKEIQELEKQVFGNKQLTTTTNATPILCSQYQTKTIM